MVSAEVVDKDNALYVVVAVVIVIVVVVAGFVVLEMSVIEFSKLDSIFLFPLEFCSSGKLSTKMLPLE